VALKQAVMPMIDHLLPLSQQSPFTDLYTHGRDFKKIQKEESTVTELINKPRYFHLVMWKTQLSHANYFHTHDHHNHLKGMMSSTNESYITQVSFDTHTEPQRRGTRRDCVAVACYNWPLSGPVSFTSTHCLLKTGAFGFLAICARKSSTKSSS
jgi:hypothetical protein